MKTLKQIALLILVANTSIIAYDKFEYAYSELAGVPYSIVNKMIENDKYYELAKKYINDKAMMKERKVNIADPEDKTAVIEIKKMSVPNYAEALNSYIRSAQEKGNPIAAYAGLYIVNNFTLKNSPDSMKKINILSKILYNQVEKPCMAYLSYGETFEKGFYKKVDINKALEIYTKGSEDSNCKTGWFNAVIHSKILGLKRRSND